VLFAVIARFIQRLTLIAFTAHAVLGCCLHHSHAIGSDCCGEQVAAECESSHDHDGHCSHSHHEHGDNSNVDQDSLLPSIEAACCACSHEHSHQCDESRCNFVPTNMKSFDFDFDQAVEQLVFDNAATETAMIRQRIIRSADRTICALARSSGQRCAALQSWQN
jgi:hypothetical protein